MDTFFLNELKKCCTDVNNDKENVNGISGVIDAYKRITAFAKSARSEGLPALEEACGHLDRTDVTQEVLFKELMLILDGTEKQQVASIGMNLFAADDFSSYEGLIVLMYCKGALLLQDGVAINLLENYLQSMMPMFLRKILVQKISGDKMTEQAKEKVESDKWVRALCEDNRAIDERDYSIINQTALTLLDMSDVEIQRLLRETENRDVVTAMIELPGKARARIFDNISSRLGRMMAEEVMHRGPVTFGEVEKACVTLMRKVIKLEADGEIAHHNLTVLKFVIGLYDVPNSVKKDIRNDRR